MRNFSGVYEIVNTENGHRYIGSAVNIRKRWNSHRSALNNNCHHSRYLQNAWNKYGDQHFKFRMIEKVEHEEKLIDIEQRYIDMIDPEYNICKMADSRLGIKHTEETKQTMSKNHADVSGKKNPRYGVKLSRETRKKISDNHADVSGKNNPRYGMPVSKETRKKISKANKGNVSPNLGKTGADSHNAKIVHQFSVKGDFIASHDCVIDAAKVVGVNRTNIAACCRGIYKTSGGYVWRYAEDGQ
jgi:group I intron endonuclease